MTIIRALLALALLASPALAQSPPVLQSGNVTPGHPATWITNGVIADAGAATVIYGPAGIGIGGAVTQTVSRVTSVTINKISGQITMFTAAGSATAASFTVNNNLVNATDVIVLNEQSGTNLYRFMITSIVDRTSFTITYFTTGGTASDAPVINFAIIKAVAN